MKALLMAWAIIVISCALASALETAVTADFGAALPTGKMADPYGPPEYGWNQGRAFFATLLLNIGLTDHLSAEGGAFYSLNHLYQGEWSDPKYVIPYSKVFLLVAGARFNLLPDSKYNPYLHGGGGLGAISYNIADNWGKELSRRYIDPALYFGAGLELEATETLSIDFPVRYGIIFWKPDGDEEFMVDWTKATIRLLYIGTGFIYWAM